MNCAKCGAALDEHAQTCPTCGADVLVVAADVPPVPSVPEVTDVSKDAQESIIPDVAKEATVSNDITVPEAPTVLEAPPMLTVPPPPPSVLPPPPPPIPNAPSFDEPNLRRWNWGAFAFGLIWVIGMRLWVWVAALLVLFVIGIIPAIKPFTSLIGIIVAIYLGLNGTRLAWQSPGRHWENAEQFERTQNVWRTWGIAILVLSIPVTILIVYFVSSAVRH